MKKKKMICINATLEKVSAFLHFPQWEQHSEIEASESHMGADDSSPFSSTAGCLRVNESSKLSTGNEAELAVSNEMIVPFMNVWVILALFFPLE
jgi:hypothetical protein